MGHRFRRDTDADPAHAAVVVTGPADIALARQAAADAAERADIPPARTSGFIVAVSEIVTNAIVHGTPPAHVVVRSDAQGVIVEVRSTAAGPIAATTSPPPDQAHGRGLWLAQELSDDLSITHGGESVTVTLTIRRAPTQSGTPDDPHQVAG